MDNIANVFPMLMTAQTLINEHNPGADQSSWTIIDSDYDSN